MRQRIASAAHVRANGLTSTDNFVRAYSEPYRKPDNIANAHTAANLPTELPALAGALTAADRRPDAPAKPAADAAPDAAPDAAADLGPDVTAHHHPNAAAKPSPLAGAHPRTHTGEDLPCL